MKKTFLLFMALGMALSVGAAKFESVGAVTVAADGLIRLRQPEAQKPAKGFWRNWTVEPGRYYRLNYAVRGDGSNRQGTGMQQYRLLLVWRDQNGAVTKKLGNIWQDALAVSLQKRWVDFTAPATAGANLTVELELRGAGGLYITSPELATITRPKAAAAAITLDLPYYRDMIFSTTGESKIAGTLRWPEASENTLALTLRDRAGNTVATSAAVARQKDGTFRFELPIPKLAPGEYQLQAGTNRRTVGKTVTVLPPAPVEVICDTDNQLRINGRRFFPLGAWSLKKAPYWEDTPEDDALLKQAAAAGINVIVGRAKNAGHLLAQLQLMARYDLKFIWIPHSFRTLPETAAAMRKWRDNLAKTLTPQVLAEPALLGYMTADEPLWTGKSFTVLQEMYAEFKRLDPYRPVWINFAPRNEPADLEPYAAAADILGVDIYPYPECAANTHSGLSDKRLTSVGAYARRLRQTVKNRKPIWMMLQGFAWADLSGDRAMTAPPPEAGWFMACEAMVHDDGIVYWGMHYNTDATFAKQLPELWRRIHAVADVMAAPTVTGEITVAAPGGTVAALHKRNDSGDYLLLVNEGEKAVSVTLKANGRTVEAGDFFTREHHKTSIPLKVQEAVWLKLSPGKAKND